MEQLQLQQSKFRDERLDTFRGLAMIWVVFNHCLFWMGFFPESIFKTYLLLGTQLFFVIAGASNGMSRKKPLWEFYSIRFKRILFPYWLYAIICLIITYFVADTFNTGKVLADWFLYFEQSSSCNPNILMWALWFVPVYLLVMALFPFLRLYYERNSKIFLQILPLLFFATLLVLLQIKIIPITGRTLHFSKMTAFYGFFTYLGLFFTTIMQRSKQQIRNAIIVVACCAITVVLAIVFYDISPSMQNNKFPPTFIFLVFSLGLLGLLYIFSNHIIRAINFCKRNSVFAWVYKQYTKHGLTIFLFHPFVFLLLAEIRRMLFGGGNNSWYAFTVIVVLAIPLSACTGYLFAWVEKLAQIKIKKSMSFS
ncbi:MAG: acyltransferase [Bacteroidetes bacterium]|nr:acyltransferase [Bacteroidota bacterium]